MAGIIAASPAWERPTRWAPTVRTIFQPRCRRTRGASLAVLPDWLSATLVARITGVLMLLVFKYTSDQRLFAGYDATSKRSCSRFRCFATAWQSVCGRQGAS